jgi:hypothetical protein
MDMPPGGKGRTQPRFRRGIPLFVQDLEDVKKPEEDILLLENPIHIPAHLRDKGKAVDLLTSTAQEKASAPVIESEGLILPVPLLAAARCLQSIRHGFVKMYVALRRKDTDALRKAMYETPVSAALVLLLLFAVEAAVLAPAGSDTPAIGEKKVYAGYSGRIRRDVVRMPIMHVSSAACELREENDTRSSSAGRHRAAPLPDRYAEDESLRLKLVSLPSRDDSAGFTDIRSLRGRISALFESGRHGVHAIGYDYRGGTSYGKYQLASRQGTMVLFVEFLERVEPRWAEMLKAAGKSNTGTRNGRMPRAWKRIASEDPLRFERLQDEFIHDLYFSPAFKEVCRNVDMDIIKHHSVFQQLLWSTAVHHGPNAGARIFIRAAGKAKRKQADNHEVALLNEIFKERKRRVDRSSIMLRDKTAIKKRLVKEKSLAMALLGGHRSKIAPAVTSRVSGS